MAIHPSATSSSLIISFNRALCIFKLQNGKKHHPNMQQPHSDPGGLISEFREGTAVISKIAQGLSRQGHLMTKSIGYLRIEQNTSKYDQHQLDVVIASLTYMCFLDSLLIIPTYPNDFFYDVSLLSIWLKLESQRAQKSEGKSCLEHSGQIPNQRQKSSFANCRAK